MSIDLRFTGVGSAFNPSMGSTSCYFMHEEDLVVIDMGESVYERIIALPLFAKARRVLVILTHCHCDHIGSLGSLCSYMAMIVRKPLEIFHPDSQRVRLFLDITGIDHSFYTIHEHVPASWNMKIREIPVRHAEYMKCFGYLFPEFGFYYSGDAYDIPDEIVSLYLKGEIQRIFHDITLKESESHCHIGRLEARIPEDRRRGVFAMHLQNRGDIIAIEKKGFSVANAYRN